MAFFDEMDRKLSQFGQSVSNKSREVSEGMRLSSAIKAEEEKQNNLYREVGKYYFENCAANAEGQLKVLCDQIVASMELTSQYKHARRTTPPRPRHSVWPQRVSSAHGSRKYCFRQWTPPRSPCPWPRSARVRPTRCRRPRRRSSSRSWPRRRTRASWRTTARESRACSALPAASAAPRRPCTLRPRAAARRPPPPGKSYSRVCFS